MLNCEHNSQLCICNKHTILRYTLNPNRTSNYPIPSWSYTLDNYYLPRDSPQQLQNATLSLSLYIYLADRGFTLQALSKELSTKLLAPCVLIALTLIHTAAIVAPNDAEFCVQNKVLPTLWPVPFLRRFFEMCHLQKSGHVN